MVRGAGLSSIAEVVPPLQDAKGRPTVDAVQIELTGETETVTRAGFMIRPAAGFLGELAEQVVEKLGFIYSSA